MPVLECPVTVTFLPTGACAFSDGSSKYSTWEPASSLISRQPASTPASTVPVTDSAAPLSEGSSDGAGDTDDGADAPEPADGAALLPAHPARQARSVSATANRRVSMIL